MLLADSFLKALDAILPTTQETEYDHARSYLIGQAPGDLVVCSQCQMATAQ